MAKKNDKSMNPYRSRKAMQRKALQLASLKGWQMRAKGEELILHR